MATVGVEARFDDDSSAVLPSASGGSRAPPVSLRGLSTKTNGSCSQAEPAERGSSPSATTGEHKLRTCQRYYNPRSAGISAGFAGGLALDRLAGSYFEKLQMPGAWVVAGTAGLLIAAAVVASAWPAMRAARVDVIQALRAD